MLLLSDIQEKLKELGIAEVLLRHQANKNVPDEFFYNEVNSYPSAHSRHVDNMQSVLDENPELEGELLALFTTVNEQDNDDRPVPNDETLYVINSFNVETGKITDGITSLTGRSPYEFDGKTFADTTRHMAALKEAGVSELFLNYSGSGDSGDGIEVKLIDANGDDISLDGLDGIADELAYAVLEEFAPGWEINEGSDGEMTFNINTGELNDGHNVNFSDFESEFTETNLSKVDLTKETKVGLKALKEVLNGASVMLDYSSEFKSITIESALIDDDTYKHHLNSEQSDLLLSVLKEIMDESSPGWSRDGGSNGRMKLNTTTGDIELDINLTDYCNFYSEYKAFSATIAGAVTYDPSVDGDLEVDDGAEGTIEMTPRPSM